LWQAFVDPLIRRRFEKETGLGRQESTGDPLHGFTDASGRENDAYAWAFAQWFNERCWKGYWQRKALTAQTGPSHRSVVVQCKTPEAVVRNFIPCAVMSMPALR
jgi:hypothetical protein